MRKSNNYPLVYIIIINNASLKTNKKYFNFITHTIYGIYYYKFRSIITYDIYVISVEYAWLIIKITN